MQNKLVSMLTMVALLAPGAVLAGDKLQGTMTQPPEATTGTAPAYIEATTPSAKFIPGESKTKVKVDDKCSVQVQLKKLTGLTDTDGDRTTGEDGVICLGHAAIFLSEFDPDGDGPGAPVTDVAASATLFLNGEVKKNGVKIKTSIDAVAGTPGVCNSANLYNVRVDCYEPLVPSATYDIAAECASAGGIYVDDATSVDGACLFLAPGEVPGPGTPLLATLGVTVPAP